MFNFASTFAPEKDKVAILHITDIQRFGAQNREAKRLIRRLREQYAALGFRSEALRQMYHEIVPAEARPEFLALSGAPFDGRPPRPCEGGPLKLVYVGRLIPRKRADALMDVAARLPFDWRLTVVGEGELRGELEARIRRHGLEGKATLTGNVPREKALALMRESDVFVLQSYDETFGIVYIEAMAQGLICVGSRGEGVDGTIVDGENGFLIDARDDEALYNLLVRIAAMSQAERDHIRNSAYETARRMTEERMAAEYLRLAGEALINSGIEWYDSPGPADPKTNAGGAP